MAKSTKRPARSPDAAPNELQAGKAVSTPSDDEVEYWGEGGAAGYLERLKNCTFLPDEQQQLLQAFNIKINLDAFSDEWAELWKEPDFVDDEAEKCNPKWVRAFQERRWLNRALSQIEPMAREHGFDTRPLLWFSRYIYGDTLSDTEKRDIRDFISLLHTAVEQKQKKEQNNDGSEIEETLSPHERKIAERNRWFYEKRKSGDTLNAILEAQGDQWKGCKIGTINGVRCGVEKHGNAIGYPLKKGKGGRPQR